LKERIMSNWLTTAVVSLVTLATFATSPAVADQRYELRPRFTVGQRWSEQRTNTFEMSTTVKDDTQIYDRNEQSTRAVLELEWEVLAIDHGIPTAARVKFGPGCETQIQQNGASQTIRHAAAGTVVTARLLPDGEVQYDPATANHPDVEATFAELFEINPGAFPRQPIAVGESWDWDQAAIADAFGGGTEDKSSIRCTLKSVAIDHGREIGEIEFKVNIQKGEAQEGGGQRIATLSESTLAGRGKMDITAGRMIELKLSGDVVMNGILYGADGQGNMQPQADITGTGKMGLESRARLLAGAGSTPAPTSRPQASEGGDFAGEYTNPEIKLTLTATGSGYTGTLRLNERDFPVRGTSEGAVLRGQFQSEDHWFDFDATLMGATLKLITGGKTHTLQKKVVPKNPLGEPGPVNPLGDTEPTNPLGGSGDAPAPASSTIAPNAPRKPHVARTYKVFRCLDEQGFRDAAGRPLEVFHMLIPDGWRFNGGVTWKINHQNIATLSRVDLVNPAELHFQVTSPDERVVIQAYPEVHFADLRGSPAHDMGLYPPGSNYGGFVVCNVMDPASYITQFVIPQQHATLHNAQIVESKEIPALVRRYDREAAIINQVLHGMFAGNLSHQAAVVTVEHEINGEPYHEAFVVVLGYLQTQGITMWSSKLNLSMRAPRDEVEQLRPVIAGILTSIEFNMRWVGEYLRLQEQAGGKIIDVDRFCRQIDAEITRNRAETNAQIHRDMYPRLAPFCDHTGPNGKRYFLETDLQHQMNENGVIRSDISLPETPGWTDMPEYTGA
jgi:hypothetical protein